MAARYSRQSGYTVSRQSRRATVRTVPRKVGFGPHAARYFGIGILAVVALFMLTQSSTGATSAYTKNDLNKQISQVGGDVASLQLEAKRVQSLQNVQNSDTAKAMVPVAAQDVTYVQKGDVAGVSTDPTIQSQQP